MHSFGSCRDTIFANSVKRPEDFKLIDHFGFRRWVRLAGSGLRIAVARVSVVVTCAAKRLGLLPVSAALSRPTDLAELVSPIPP